MKILHVIESLGHGGAELVLGTLLPSLKSLNENEVAVAVLGGPYDLKARLEKDGIEVIEMAPHGRWNLWAGMRNIAKLIRAQKYDIVHTHLYFPTLYVGMAKTFRLIKTPSFVTYHNQVYIPGYFRSNFKNNINRLLASIFFRRGFTSHLGVSAAVSRHYEKALGLKKVGVFHNPVDLEKIQDIISLRDTRPVSDKAHIVLPGRLVHEKGHLGLIKSLEGLVKDGFNMHLTIAGEGPMRAEIIKKLQVSGLKAMTTMTGPLEHSDMLSVIKSADIVVVPSLYEGFGLTAAEALALKKPVIATDAGGLPEFVIHEKTGLIVPRDDFQALGHAILRFWTDKTLAKKCARAGASHVIKHFSPDNLAKQLVEIYTAKGSV